MGEFTTSDGVILRYVERGQGRPLVLVPGWSQAAEQFEAQIDSLSARNRVIALDMRGHGRSDKPDHGYRVARLAVDLKEFLDGLELEDVAAAGHSMGTSVLWSHWDLFGRGRITDTILIDQAPAVTARPGWNDRKRLEAGCLFEPAALAATAASLAGPEGAAVTEGFVGGMFSAAYPRDRVARVVELNLMLPRGHAADLLVDHCTQDWRDTIPRVRWRTLVIGGRASIFSAESQAWVAAQIPGARVEIFEEAEGGRHFMFMENAPKTNALLQEFLG